MGKVSVRGENIPFVQYKNQSPHKEIPGDIASSLEILLSA